MIRGRPLLAGILLCLGIQATGSAATLAEYRNVLHSSARMLSDAVRAEQARSGSGRAAIDRLLKEIPSSIVVGTGRDSYTRADLSWIRMEAHAARALSGKARLKRLETLLRQVDALESAVPASIATDVVPPARAREVLHAVLARSEFRPSPFDQLVRKYVRRLVYWLGKMLEGIGLPSEAVNFVPWVLLALAVGAAAIALYSLALRLVGLSRARRIGQRQPDAGETARQMRHTVESLLAQAERVAAQGSYKDAFRGIYMATLLLLDRAHLIAYMESGTNWEYLRALRRQGTADAAEVFTVMTALFDELIYGKAAVSQRHYLDFLRHYRRMEAML